MMRGVQGAKGRLPEEVISKLNLEGRVAIS